MFKTNDVVSERIVKTLIIKHGIYTNIFAEKMWVAYPRFVCASEKKKKKKKKKVPFLSVDFARVGDCACVQNAQRCRDCPDMNNDPKLRARLTFVHEYTCCGTKENYHFVVYGQRRPKFRRIQDDFWGDSVWNFKLPCLLNVFGKKILGKQCRPRSAITECGIYGKE